MTDLRKAAEMALAKLDHLWEIAVDERMNTDVLPEIKALRQALAQPDSNCNGMPAYEGPLSKSQALLQPEQEPVAWREVAGRTTKYYDYNEDGKGEPLYTKPPKWQRLTDDEIKEVYVKRGVTLTFNDFARAIEAKLKEKNCG